MIQKFLPVSWIEPEALAEPRRRKSASASGSTSKTNRKDLKRFGSSVRFLWRKPCATALRLIVFVFAFQGAIRAQELLVDPEMVGIFPGFQGPLANSKTQLLKQVRGLIQNELSIIGELCGLDKNQKQRLVDLAESEWKAKTHSSVIKGTQENVYGTVDLDGLAERVVRTWLEATATVEQLAVYDAELANRMKWRQKTLISKILDTLEAKLNLSGVQMEQIEAILNEKWRDRWYRSLEATFDNSAILPEIRPSWISELLTDAQKAALVTRDPQTRFGTHQGSLSYPSLAMDKRYSVGATMSSDSIELEGAVNAKKP